MAEQKEIPGTSIELDDLVYHWDDDHAIKPQDMRWEFKAKLPSLGREGRERLVSFMMSLGFACEDMPKDFKRRFSVKEGGKRLSDLEYAMGVGACLFQGYDCVLRGGDIIATYF